MTFYSERIAQGLYNSVRSFCAWGDGVRKQIDLIVITELVSQKAMPGSKLLAPRINCLFEFQGHSLMKAIARSVNKHGTRKGESFLVLGPPSPEKCITKVSSVGSDPFSLAVRGVRN